MRRRQRWRFVWRLAVRDVVEDRLVSLIVVAMLGFSFLNLVFFPAFISGLSDAFTSELVQTQSGHVTIRGNGSALQDVDALVANVSRMNGVETVEKRLRFRARVSADGRTQSAEMIGTTAYGETVYGPYMQEGQFLKRDANRSIVLGYLLATEEENFGTTGLGVDVGQNVTVRRRGFSDQFRVVGTVGRPGASPLPQQGFVSYETAAALLDKENQATAINILLRNPEQADEMKQRLQKMGVPGNVETWREVSDVTESISDTFTIVVAIISLVSIIIMVTSVGVVVFINTNKRAREIGVIRAIGTPDRLVIAVFVLESVIFGVLGVVVGNLFMYGIHRYLAANPVVTPIGVISTSLSPDLLLGRSLWMLAVTLIAGFLPAYLASKRDIVNTIEAR